MNYPECSQVISLIFARLRSSSLVFARCLSSLLGVSRLRASSLVFASVCLRKQNLDDLVVAPWRSGDDLGVGLLGILRVSGYRLGSFRGAGV